MNIQEIEKQITSKVISHHQDFDKAVLNITGYTLTEVTGFSFPLQYFKNNLVLNLPVNWSISEDIKLLLNLIFKRGIKTNKGCITIYPDGSYESSFIWDNEAHLGYLKQSLETWLDDLYEQAIYRVQDRNNQFGLDWNYTTEFIISFTNDKPNPALFITENNPQMTFKLHLHQVHEYMEEDYQQFYEAYDTSNIEQDCAYNIEQYKKFSSEDLKDVFLRWNKATFIINSESRFDFNAIKFEWLPENET